MSLQTAHVEFQLWPWVIECQLCWISKMGKLLSVLWLHKEISDKYNNNFMYCGIGKYELPMYCLYIILNAGITQAWAQVLCFLMLQAHPKPNSSPQMGWAWAGFRLCVSPLQQKGQYHI